MQIIQSPQTEEVTDCPYLPGRRKSYEYFFAGGLSAAEISSLLAEGWRKFGPFFFRPDCPGCRLCIPLRVLTADFVPSRSQRRALKRAGGLRASFGPLRAGERVWEIYRRHASLRFAQESDRDDFLFNFYIPSCPTLQTEVALGDELVGAGFLDHGEDCLSSVYFCFDPRYASLNPGTFSILREIEHARRLGLPYYYLGYYVPGSPRMAYKDHFRPREHYDWESRTWRRIDGPPGCADP